MFVNNVSNVLTVFNLSQTQNCWNGTESIRKGEPLLTLIEICRNYIRAGACLKVADTAQKSSTACKHSQKQKNNQRETTKYDKYNETNMKLDTNNNHP